MGTRKKVIVRGGNFRSEVRITQFNRRKKQVWCFKCKRPHPSLINLKLINRVPQLRCGFCGGALGLGNEVFGSWKGDK